MPSFAAPSSAIPDWLRSDNTGQLQAILGSLPSLFSTKGLTNRTNTAIDSELNQGRAIAAAGARGYANRAAQTGASSLGAGFAEGQAMLPYFNQRNSMLSDLEQKKMLAHAQQGQLTSDLAGRIAQLQQMRQGMVTDYSTAQQKLQQDSNQFDTSQAERSREFNVTAGQQQQATNLNALQLAMKTPRASYWWNTNMSGNPSTSGDAAKRNAYQGQEAFFTNTRNALARYF